MEIALRHEKGQSTTLSWTTLNETFSQIRSVVTGETAEVSKNQPAVALKVGTQLLVEKLIGFQDFKFQKRANDLINAHIEIHNHLKKIRPDAYQAETLQSKEFADVVDFFKKNIFW